MATQSPQRNAFADRLRQRIKASGKSQRAIARSSGLEESTVSRFMLGKGGLTLDSIEAILTTLTMIEDGDGE